MATWYPYVFIGAVVCVTGCNRLEHEVPQPVTAVSPSLSSIPAQIPAEPVETGLGGNLASSGSEISVNQQIVNKKAAARVSPIPATYDPNLAPAPMAQ